MINVKAFDNVLSKIIKAEAGIRKVILVDRTGLTIAHVSKFSYFPIDVDGVGAAVFVASEEQGVNLDLGDLDIVSSEFSKGKIFAASCGKGILCVITDNDVNIGLVRLVLKREASEIEKLLNEFLSEKITFPTSAAVDAASASSADDSMEDNLEEALKELEKF
ncbi:MAG: roadblock/LC7 domain-containing protein [Candidatus Heimdallarchaeota archaeon]